MVKAAIQPKISLEQSPLYKLFSRNRLATILGLSLNELTELQNDNLYRHFVDRTGSKPRAIQEPSLELKKAQARIKGLLARIETPDWIFSGKHGVSYIDNAKRHAESGYIVNLDVANFYASSRRSFVFKMLRHTFKTSKQVGSILSNLLCCGEIIPTGGPASQMVAFWTYKSTFERIHELAREYGCNFSLYVDDMAFSSSSPIPSALDHRVLKELERVSLCLKKEKTKKTSQNVSCKITGVSLKGSGQMAIPNSLQRRVFEMVAGKELCDFSSREIASIEGMIAACQQIEPGKFNPVKGRFRAIRQARASNNYPGPIL